MSFNHFVILSILAIVFTVVSMPNGPFESSAPRGSLSLSQAPNATVCLCETRETCDPGKDTTNQVLRSIEKALIDQSENEIPFPVEGNWVQHGGMEYQLTTATPIVQTSSESFVYYIWIRNPGEEPKSIHVVSHPIFLPHFELEVTSQDGATWLEGQCCKKHDYKRISFSPGQLRGFRMDAFQTWCRRLKSWPENSTSFTFAYRGATLLVQTRVRQE